MNKPPLSRPISTKQGTSPRPVPDFVKMDIEGAGTFALKALGQNLLSRRPIFYMESHSSQEDSAIGDFILKMEYEGLRLQNLKWIKDKNSAYPVPDGVWGNILAVPREKHSAIAEALNIEPVGR